MKEKAPGETEEMELEDTRPKTESYINRLGVFVQ